jgi:hypothetical protein
MKTVYVAGAMNGSNIIEVMNNIRRGVKLGADIFKLGYAPFIPHLDIAFILQNPIDLSLPIEMYYDYSMEFLTRCDCIIVCEKSENSKGTKLEIEKAKQLGIPIYYSVEELEQANGLS